MPPTIFAAQILRPLLRLRGSTHHLAGEQTRREAVNLARARRAAVLRVVRMIIDDPELARDQLVDLLARGWMRFFRLEWERVATTLRLEADARSRLCAQSGWMRAISSLSPAIDVRPDGRIAIDKLQNKLLTLSDRGLVLVPTVFGNPHINVFDEPSRPVVVHYPIPRPSRAAERRVTMRRFSSLAHPARLEVCRAIATEPRSAREIARLWRFTESAVTKHLSVLRNAGLVRVERVGPYVRYSLDASAIDTLGADLLEVLRR